MHQRVIRSTSRREVVVEVLDLARRFIRSDRVRVLADLREREPPAGFALGVERSAVLADLFVLFVLFVLFGHGGSVRS